MVFRKPGQQHFPKGGTVQGKSFSRPAANDNRILAFFFRQIDAGGTIQNAQMAGKTGLVTEKNE
ncbi:hypothetical protein EIMP300_01560 [Escherichia coli]|uniref:Uncharacterized protein n=1 Tax=Escherichia coli TaxID=562 RepID=A0A8S0FFP0_ECOLX|nr:hypothetical protein EIMP300_01560 [Escherichia coli]